MNIQQIKLTLVVNRIFNFEIVFANKKIKKSEESEVQSIKYEIIKEGINVLCNDESPESLVFFEKLLNAGKEKMNIPIDWWRNQIIGNVDYKQQTMLKKQQLVLEDTDDSVIQAMGELVEKSNEYPALILNFKWQRFAVLYSVLKNKEKEMSLFGTEQKNQKEIIKDLQLKGIIDPNMSQDSIYKKIQKFMKPYEKKGTMNQSRTYSTPQTKFIELFFLIDKTPYSRYLNARSDHKNVPVKMMDAESVLKKMNEYAEQSWEFNKGVEKNVYNELMRRVIVEDTFHITHFKKEAELIKTIYNELSTSFSTLTKLDSITSLFVLSSLEEEIILSIRNIMDKHSKLIEELAIYSEYPAIKDTNHDKLSKVISDEFLSMFDSMEKDNSEFMNVMYSEIANKYYGDFFENPTLEKENEVNMKIKNVKYRY